MFAFRRAPYGAVWRLWSRVVCPVGVSATEILWPLPATARPRQPGTPLPEVVTMGCAHTWGDGPNPGTEQCSSCGAIRTKNY